jgi:(4-(4-[2-(gamma-L-glutamylamino)ethyl]phenoxymethyl)furan-2-yl)methanamine synthase
VGRDAADAGTAEWTGLARWFAEAQIRAVLDGAGQVLGAVRLPDGAPIVSAGIGAGIAGAVAERLGRPHVPFENLLDVAPEARAPASCCAPAAALAILAHGE